MKQPGMLCRLFFKKMTSTCSNSILRVLAQDDFAFAKSPGEMGKCFVGARRR